MELVLFILALMAIFAVKSFAILNWQEDEIAKSTSFSWTKPGAMDAIAVPEHAIAEEAPRLASSGAWTPYLAAQRLRVNRLAMPIAR